MTDLKFTAEYRDEEPNERSAEWSVVEWGPRSQWGGRSGKTVRKFGPYDEAGAVAYAAELNYLDSQK